MTRDEWKKKRSGSVYGAAVADPACCRNCDYLESYYHGFQDGQAKFSFCCLLYSTADEQPYHIDAPEMEGATCTYYERKYT